jgi:hypothetical protein
VMPDDLFWRTPEGQDLAAVVCAKYNVSSLPQLIYLKSEQDG